jgi:cytochrome c553
MKMRQGLRRATIAVDGSGTKTAGAMFDWATAGWLIRRGLHMASAVGVACMAAGQATDAHTADIELGRYLASECLTCHRTASAGNVIPNIFGLPETTFAEVVKAYRDKRMANPVMQNVASRLTDEDIAALALYFATSKMPK